ncbi:MAG: energy-coupling factor transporter transmembrane protein EcfT [Bacilli bacterium]|jgi:energy-coupling factor transport system permease protein|nr:energy-coupling factor transporter transmembrane protein EcfT [Bacilli bacterium]
MKEFQTYNPFVILFYFMSVIFFTMFQANPLFLIISLFIAIIFNIKINGFKEAKRRVLFYLIFFCGCVLANAIFVHEGITSLFYVNGNAITLEALIYGMVFGCLLISIIIWFNCFSKLMSSDKIIYLFSKSVSTIGLMISMILRFIPRFQLQLKKIISINNLNNFNKPSKNIIIKLKTVFNYFSILLTWAFENSLDTATIMKARGYGLKNRTSFHLYKFDVRDIIVLVIIIVLIIINISFYLILNLRFYYYPEIAPLIININYLMAYFNYIILLGLPLIIELKEELKWKLLISKI